MLRIALFCGLILPATRAFAEDKKEIPKDLIPFQGSWKLVKVESGGKGPPESLTEEVRFTFTGNTLTIREGKGQAVEGTYTVDSKKEPGEIDMSEGKEKVFGIFKFEKDNKLIISHAIKPGGARPKKFDEATAVTLVMEKINLKDIPKELVPFQGRWKVVKLEVGGKEPPGALKETQLFHFEGNQLTFQVGKGAAQEGSFSIDSKKEPSEIDLMLSKTEKNMGIYKFDQNGKLTITTATKTGSPRPKKFDEAETVTFVLEKTG